MNGKSGPNIGTFKGSRRVLAHNHILIFSESKRSQTGEAVTDVRPVNFCGGHTSGEPMVTCTFGGKVYDSFSSQHGNLHM